MATPRRMDAHRVAGGPAPPARPDALPAPGELSPLAVIASAAACGAAAVLVARAVRRRAARAAFDLAGRHVLITGGARGLGLALAREFADHGARLAIVSRSADELERARLELAARGAPTTTHRCDVRDPLQVADLVRDVVAETGRLDVLVNNAGVMQMMPFEHATLDDFKDSLDTHFWAPLHLIRESLPYLTAAGGRIVNISSIGGRVAVPHLLPYSAGKFALTGLSEGLQGELARLGVRVLTVTPGLMRTGSHRNVVVRGRHREEAMWFGLAGATSLTSMSVDRAASAIVQACREGRTRITPGVQARSAEVLNVLAAELLPAAMRLVARLLPRSDDGDAAPEARWSRDLDLGWAASLMPSGAAAEMNQPMAADEV